MNKQILKFAKKSGATINEGFDGNKAFVYGITLSPEELEKFAELIVEEMYDFMCKATDNDGAWPSSKEVKQHFGVE